MTLSSPVAVKCLLGNVSICEKNLNFYQVYFMMCPQVVNMIFGSFDLFIAILD